MRRKLNRSPEEMARREKISEMLQALDISSMDDIKELYRQTIAQFMENSLGSELDESLGYERYDQTIASWVLARNRAFFPPQTFQARSPSILPAKALPSSAFRPITVLNSPIAFQAARAIWKPSLRQRPDNCEFATSLSAPILPATTERRNAAIERTKRAFTTHTVSIPSPTLVGS